MQSFKIYIIMFHLMKEITWIEIMTKVSIELPAFEPKYSFLELFRVS